MRAYLGTRLFRVAGHNIYGGVSWTFHRVLYCNHCGQVNREAGVVIGFLIGLWLLARVLR